MVGRLDVLRDVLRGRGRWVEAIAHEVEASSAYIPDLGGIADEGWLGDPIEIDDPKLMADVARTRRVVFGGDVDNELRHLGEAQTCELIRTVEEYADSWWITDDQDALRYARGQQITTRETIEIVSIAVVEGSLSSEDGFELMHAMKSKGRSLRLPVNAAELMR
ncbi:hypothetical protein FXW78_50015 [Rhodococcus opacus]|nr:hypothetical protein [Rhodococcus opacus]